MAYDLLIYAGNEVSVNTCSTCYAEKAESNTYIKNQSDIGSKLKKEIPAPVATVRAGNKTQTA
jgi:hypothetical protein